MAAAAPVFPFLGQYAFLKNADGSFRCLGRGGNGGVYDGTRLPAAELAPGFCGAALAWMAAQGTELAIKQTVYGRADTEAKRQRMQTVIEREGQQSVKLCELFFGRQPWSVMAFTLDTHLYGTVGIDGCVAHTVMERSPISVPEPFAAPAGAILPPRAGELMGSNTDLLGNPFIAPGRLTLREARFILKQLLTALQAMHESGRVHRDVKVDNLLVWGCSRPGAWGKAAVAATETVELGDGTAVMVDRRLEGLYGHIAPPAGTPEGMNPFVCTSLPFPAGDDETRYVWVSGAFRYILLALCCCPSLRVNLSVLAAHALVFRFALPLQVKLCDFGFARDVDEDVLEKGLTKNPGTLSTMAPETFEPAAPGGGGAGAGVRHYDERCDVFSAGALFFALVTGLEPSKDPRLGLEHGRFPGLNRPEGPPRAGSGRPFSEGSVELDLLTQMTRLALDGPQPRLTAAEALAHPFFSDPL